MSTPPRSTHDVIMPSDAPPRLSGAPIAEASLVELPHPRPRWFAIDVGDEGLSEVVDHVSNVRWLAWLDRVAELAGEDLGHDRATLATLERMWFVGRHEIDYLAEVMPGDRLHAATWIHDARRTSCRRAIRLFRGETAVCRALTTWIWIDLAKRRPVRLPADVRTRLDPLLQEDAPDTAPA